ncbi:MAG: autotransporter [Solirubrobacteraceae bacterium]
MAAAALTTAAFFGPGAAGAAAPSAKAARTLNLSDSANLVQNNKKGTELKESGTAKGNLPGKIYIQLRVANTKNVTAKIQVYPNSRDAISATASASYRLVTSSSASFSGSLNITGGRGRYAKVKGAKLSFSGAVHRPSNSVSVRVSGKISY